MKKKVKNPARQKLGKQSREKGKRYELKIATAVNKEFLTHYKRTSFQRKSGARELMADLQCDPKRDRLKLFIECKYREFSWAELVLGNAEAEGPLGWFIAAAAKTPPNRRTVLFFYSSRKDFVMYDAHNFSPPGAPTVWEGTVLFPTGIAVSSLHEFFGVLHAEQGVPKRREP